MLDLALTVLEILLVIFIPFAVSHGSEVLMHHVAHHEFAEVPILTTLARLQGLAIGGLLLHMDLDAHYYDLQLLFLPDSPWNLTFMQFLFERSNIFAYDFMPVLRLIPGVPAPLSILTTLVLIGVPLLQAGLCLRFWRIQDALRGYLACLGTTLWSAWISIYLVSMAFWGLFLLNFWSLALAAAYIQYRRTHKHH